MGNKKKIFFSISLAVCLWLGLSFGLSQAQSESELSQQLELASAQLSETTLISPVISMDFQNADLKDVLKIFSQQAGLNFIASENVKDRKVTLYLDRVSVKDALDTLMRANNLTYEQEEDSKIFVVKEWGRPEVETITKVFQLQYAKVRGYEFTEVEGEQQETGIKEIIEKLLTAYGRVVEDSRTNSLVITDVPSQFPQIEKAIKELDIKLPQVMIEAEVIETSLDTIDRLGIEWGSTSDGNLASAFGAARFVKFPFTKDKSHRQVVTREPSGLTTGYISANNLGGILAMLHRDTDSRILARPKILTVNNEPAEIKIVANTAVASITSQAATEGLATQTITPERVETGISLKVTPQINKKGEITMVIEPSVTNVKQSTFFSQFVDPQTRSVKTTVTVNDGETVIIGGLINTEDEKSLRKVPFLGDIPLLGNLFRKKEDSSIDKELIIFITPRLVKEGEKTPALALERQAPWEYESLGLKERAMEEILDRFEE